MNFAKHYNIYLPSSLDENQPILVVDSNVDMRMIVIHQLKKLNFKNIIQAQSGIRALTKMKNTENISVVIASYNLSDMSGIEILSEMKDNTEIPSVPFCLTINESSKDKILLAIEAGVDEILVTPYTLTEIVPKIRNTFKLFHNSTNPEIVYELAKQHMREQDEKSAEDIFTTLHDAAPKRARPLVGLAKIKNMKNENKEALELLSKAEKNNPNYIHIYPLKSKILIEEKRYEEALHSYLFAIELSPLNPLRYPAPMELLIEQKKYSEVIEILKKAFKHNISYHPLYYYMSFSYYKLDNIKESLNFAINAWESDGDNLSYHLHLSILYEALDRFPDAIKIINDTLQLDSKNYQALMQKGSIFEKQGKFKEAKKIFEKVLQLYPDSKLAVVKLVAIKDKIVNSGNK